MSSIADKNKELVCEALESEGISYENVASPIDIIQMIKVALPGLSCVTIQGRRASSHERHVKIQFLQNMIDMSFYLAAFPSGMVDKARDVCNEIMASDGGRMMNLKFLFVAAADAYGNTDESKYIIQVSSTLQSEGEALVGATALMWLKLAERTSRSMAEIIDEDLGL